MNQDQPTQTPQDDVTAAETAAAQAEALAGIAPPSAIPAAAPSSSTPTDTVAVPATSTASAASGGAASPTDTHHIEAGPYIAPNTRISKFALALLLFALIGGGGFVMAKTFASKAPILNQIFNGSRQ